MICTVHLLPPHGPYSDMYRSHDTKYTQAERIKAIAEKIPSIVYNGNNQDMIEGEKYWDPQRKIENLERQLRRKRGFGEREMSRDEFDKLSAKLEGEKERIEKMDMEMRMDDSNPYEEIKMIIPSGLKRVPQKKFGHLPNEIRASRLNAKAPCPYELFSIFLDLSAFLIFLIVQLHCGCCGKVENVCCCCGRCRGTR